MTHVYVKRRSTAEGAEWENVGIFLASDDLHLDLPPEDSAPLLGARFRQVVEQHLAASPPQLLFGDAVDWLTPAVLYRFTTVRPSAAIRG